VESPYLLKNYGDNRLLLADYSQTTDCSFKAQTTGHYKLLSVLLKKKTKQFRVVFG